MTRIAYLAVGLLMLTGAWAIAADAGPVLAEVWWPSMVTGAPTDPANPRSWGQLVFRADPSVQADRASGSLLTAPAGEFGVRVDGRIGSSEWDDSQRQTIPPAGALALGVDVRVKHDWMNLYLCLACSSRSGGPGAAAEVLIEAPRQAAGALDECHQRYLIEVLAGGQVRLSAFRGANGQWRLSQTGLGSMSVGAFAAAVDPTGPVVFEYAIPLGNLQDRPGLPPTLGCAVGLALPGLVAEPSLEPAPQPAARPTSRPAPEPRLAPQPTALPPSGSSASTSPRPAPRLEPAPAPQATGQPVELPLLRWPGGPISLQAPYLATFTTRPDLWGKIGGAVLDPDRAALATPRSAGRPTVDGRLAPGEWHGPPVSFAVAEGGIFEVYAQATEQSLLVAAALRGFVADTSKLTCELFIDPNNDEGLIVRADDRRFALAGGKAEARSWANGAWSRVEKSAFQAHAAAEGQLLVCEFEIPFTDLGKAGPGQSMGMAIQMNVGRKLTPARP